MLRAPESPGPGIGNEPWALVAAPQLLTTRHDEEGSRFFSSGRRRPSDDATAVEPSIDNHRGAETERHIVNKHPGILGKKLGMTQFFTEKGEVIRCTVVQAGCVVVGKRTTEKDGYDALVLGLGERKEKHTSKPLAGQYKKINQTPKRVVRELRLSAEEVAKYELGEKVAVDKVFEVGQFVDAKGKTRGRGFTGVMRRWSFAGGVDSHGTHEYFRHGGSIGTNMTPGRTLPGLKMPGHYGDETVSIMNLKIAKLIPEDDIVLVEGGIPGAKNTIITLRGAVKKKNAGKKA
ncbi:MAG: 50S ribosomal protein L3 [Polyangiaceae bacterium]|nr:50S ribosomal protein L3 [Polyangiaceae bacterium]